MDLENNHNLTVRCVDLGRRAYAPVLELQQRLVDRAAAGGPEHLLLVEHDPPVITLGRRARAEHILASPERLSRLGVETHRTSRGGDVTYHGPGQLVAYFIGRVSKHRSLHRLQHDLEEAVIRLLSRCGFAGQRVSGRTGVWVGSRKIAAIGVAARRWVSYHGLALNVCPDLDHFGLIVPCGLADAGVTSLHQLGAEISMQQARDLLVESFAEAFGVAVEWADAAECIPVDADAVVTGSQS